MFTAVRPTFADAAAAVIGTLIFAGACLGTATAPARAATPAENAVRTRSVAYGDLNLASAAGQHRLALRIRAAARAVCDQPGNELWTWPDESGCMRAAIAATRNQTMAAIAGAGRAG